MLDVAQLMCKVPVRTQLRLNPRNSDEKARLVQRDRAADISSGMYNLLRLPFCSCSMEMQGHSSLAVCDQPC